MIADQKDLEARMDTPDRPDDSRTASALVPSSTVSMFERLACDPRVDVEKLERLIGMQERILAHQAKAAFDADFARMQGDLPIVAEKGTTNNGRYARLEDIIAAVRPVLAKHGFSLSHTSQWPSDKAVVRIVGILAHRDGHEKRSEFLTGPDASGNKNGIQGLGSALSYGRRYTTLDLLGIASSADEDDGRAAGKTAPPVAPKGYDEWMDNLSAVADEGFKRLQDTYNQSRAEFREYLSKYENPKIEALKAKARRVAAS